MKDNSWLDTLTTIGVTVFGSAVFLAICSGIAALLFSIAYFVYRAALSV